MKELTIGVNDAGRRLDRFLRKYMPGASLAAIYKMIRKDVKVNGRRADEGYVLLEGDVIRLYVSDEDFATFTAVTKARDTTGVRRNFKIIYEDDCILAADKPFGLLTHGDRTEKKNHLANQVKDYLIEIGAYDPRERVFVPAPANRLDRNTTGLVLFGKTSEALSALTGMIRDDLITKRYMTIVHGTVSRPMTLEGRLVKDEATNKARVLPLSAAEGKVIRTQVAPVQQLSGATLVEVILDTGRTHQIRAHLASAGHPVIGDTKYQTAAYRKANDDLRRRFGLSTQLLHSSSVTFHAADGPLAYLNGQTIRTDLPESFRQIIAGLSGGNR